MPVCSGKGNQGGFFCLSLLWSCLSEATGDQTWNCWHCQPRIKFVRLSQICLCQIWQRHLTCYSHLEPLMVCQNCLNLRVGDLESTDWWMPISFLFLRQKKEKQVFPLLRRKKNWNAAFSFIPASSAFTRGKMPSSKPSPRSPIRRKQPTHLYVLDINLWGLPCFPASTLPHSPSILPMTARVTL